MSRMNESIAGQGQQGGAAQLKEKAQEVKDNLREMGSQARDVAKEQYENLRSQANEYYEQGRERINEYTESLEQYVQEQPIKSLLIAAGVGVLLGILWKR